MVGLRNMMIRRRDLILVAPGAGLLGISACTPDRSSQATSDATHDKRRPQYQANSPEVQAFYRVNRYPEG